VLISVTPPTFIEQAAARAAELQKNPWGAVKQAIRRGSFDALESQDGDDDNENEN
jgi:hypothetical protein